MGLVDGRVVVVTGAGRGIGRAHALAFAAEGAHVVVNDIGAGPAREVVDEIIAAGGEAVVNGDDIADLQGASSLIQTAVDTFGGLDVLVNNAGFIRGAVLAETGEADWDAVVRVHLKGHFATLRHAARYWRDQAKAGAAVDARVINTSSAAGLQGSVGQGNYSAAKAGVAALTLVAAAELRGSGIAVNAIAPTARTRMTDAAFAETMERRTDGFDEMAPENISPLAVWLGSAESRGVTGKVFEVQGGLIRVAEGWAHGPQIDKGARWEPAELGPVIANLLAKSTPPIPVHDPQSIWLHENRQNPQEGKNAMKAAVKKTNGEQVMKRFDKRTVIVTGGARGMGANHARGFVAEGANVVIADILEQEGRTLAQELGDHAIFSRLDVTSDKDWAATVAAAQDAFGPVSVLINNAGIARFSVIEETEPAVWRQVMEVNLTGVYLGIRAVVSSMRKAGGGAIVNISSGAGFTATFGLAAYVASKWGVRGLTKTAALELGRDNIRVNSIHPGAIRTPILDAHAPDAKAMAATMAGAGVGLSAIPRIAEPEEITRLVLFVASNEASFSTGSEFIADGGLLLGPVPS